MDIHFTGKYKCIRPFEWIDIPSFAIVTGINGSGKSQLLELIAIAIERNGPDNVRKEIQLKGFSADRTQIMCLSAGWDTLDDLHAVGLGDLQSESDEVWGQFRAWQGEPQNRRAHRPFHDFFQRTVSSLSAEPKDVTRGDLIKRTPVNLVVRRGAIFNQSFSRACLRYKFRSIELHASGVGNEDIEHRLGRAPWVVLNEMLREAQLTFHVNDPVDIDITDKFECRLIDSSTSDVVPFKELSSGEKVLISLVFWLFNSTNRAVFPTILLLDEPDAHLHPSMTKRFLDVIQNYIVKQQNVRVFMTSHSPSTIAMAPEESLFEIRRDAPRVRKISRNDAIATLSEGLIVVRPGLRWVFVEDKSDEEFYSCVFSELVRTGKLSPVVPLVFRSAGADSRQSTPGGRTNVEKWVGKLREAGFSEVSGLVDNDNNVTTVPGVELLLACSPKTGPCGMRVSSARLGKEILDEANTTPSGANRQEAA